MRLVLYNNRVQDIALDRFEIDMKKKIYLLASFCCLVHSIGYAQQPRLIVQIIIDQLRGDQLVRYQKHFSDTGFNYLLNNSLNYQQAYHPHANTTTCAGHATIATGSYPALHGIVNNEWYDSLNKKMIYCTEDIQASIIPNRFTQEPLPGRSPRNIMVSTLSDEIVLANKGRAFAVSYKDRSAITLAGHAGKAFWFDTTHGGFITSDWYYKQYPTWVSEWNKGYQASDFTWNLQKPAQEYTNFPSSPIIQNDQFFGQKFPHQVTHQKGQNYFKALSKTPKADQLSADFAIQLLAAEKLGSDPGKTDYLAISFSAVDAIGHHFGANSLEAEDNLMVLDKTLSHLLKNIDTNVGLANTLIILTADHGVNDPPNYLTQHHFAAPQPLNLAALTQFIHTILKNHQLPTEILTTIIPPYIYLNDDLMRNQNMSMSQLTDIMTTELMRRSEIFRAFTLPIVSHGWLSAKVNRMYYPYRTGQIYLVQPSNQAHGAKNTCRVNHGSPWNYDRYVPLLFVNPHFKKSLFTREVHTTDIAPTLSVLLNIKVPSGSVGQTLPEVISNFNAITEITTQVPDEQTNSAAKAHND